MDQRTSRGRGSSGAGPRPRLSQHFLADREVARRIVEAFAPGPSDHVLEIGPGRGALTALVAGRVARLVVIELDRALAAALPDRLPPGTPVEVVAGDVLALDLAAVRGPGPPLRVLANLPYAVSSPVLLKLLAEREAIAGALLMLQLELAERLAAAPGGRDYGSLSALVQSRMRVTAVLDVPPGAFRPPPRVRSRVVRLDPLAEPLVADPDWDAFRRLLRAAFSARRKTLANSLAAGLGRSREDTARRIAAGGHDPGTRAERLSPADFAALARGTFADLLDAARPQPPSVF